MKLLTLFHVRLAHLQADRRSSCCLEKNQMAFIAAWASHPLCPCTQSGPSAQLEVAQQREAQAQRDLRAQLKTLAGIKVPAPT
jgi:hypothetical protein